MLALGAEDEHGGDFLAPLFGWEADDCGFGYVWAVRSSVS